MMRPHIITSDIVNIAPNAAGVVQQQTTQRKQLWWGAPTLKAASSYSRYFWIPGGVSSGREVLPVRFLRRVECILS